MRVCELAGCSEKHRAKGLCEVHYHRQRQTGSTETRRIRGDDEARFWSKVEKGEDHWVWVGARDSSGYGKFDVARRHRGAHRYAYELLVGPIGDGHWVTQLCGVRHCVKPDHLEQITP
jgi:hypothetical protein